MIAPARISRAVPRQLIGQTPRPLAMRPGAGVGSLARARLTIYLAGCWRGRGGAFDHRPGPPPFRWLGPGLAPRAFDHLLGGVRGAQRIRNTEFPETAIGFNRIMIRINRSEQDLIPEKALPPLLGPPFLVPWAQTLAGFKGHL